MPHFYRNFVFGRSSKLSYVFVIILLGYTSLAQQYNVLTIGQELLTNANAVVRLEQKEFEVIDKGRATQRIKNVTTILNEEAADVFTTFQVNYNKFIKVKKLEGKVYNALGKEIYSLKNSDIRDIGLGVVQQSEISDTRVKLAQIDKKNFNYPFTIEYELELEVRNLMFYPEWTPQPYDHLSVEKATFQLKMPVGLHFRSKEINKTSELQKTISDDGLIATWSVKNLKPIETPSFTPKNHRMKVLTSPVTFQLDDYTGTFTTWEAVSAFYYDLNKGRDALPATTIEKIKAYTASATTPQEKVRLVYEYLQNNTRYFGIQLGVGGWQTITAEKVVSTGYGDCKALTNYMNALLKSVGIEAYSVLINAGEENNTLYYDDFPSATFNHVISCVPLQKDTLWLECTSQTETPNFLGSFTGNRKGLIIKPIGGKLINTQWYEAPQNQRYRTATILLDDTGKATANIHTTYSGIQYETLNSVITTYSADEQRTWLQQEIEIGSFELQNFSLKRTTKQQPIAEENLHLSIRNCATSNGQRIFLKPNLMASFIKLPSETERKEELYLNPNEYSFVHTDSLVYQLPEGYQVEYLPPTTPIESRFGSYTQRTRFEEGKLYFTRKVTLTGGFYPAESYQELLEYIKKIQKADKVKAVFVKK